MLTLRTQESSLRSVATPRLPIHCHMFCPTWRRVAGYLMGVEFAACFFSPSPSWNRGAWVRIAIRQMLTTLRIATCLAWLERGDRGSRRMAVLRGVLPLSCAPLRPQLSIVSSPRQDRHWLCLPGREGLLRVLRGPPDRQRTARAHF